MRKVMSFFIIVEVIIIVLLAEIMLDEKKQIEPKLIYQSDIYTYKDYEMCLIIENIDSQSSSSDFNYIVKMKYIYNNTVKYFDLVENNISKHCYGEYDVNWFDNYFSIYMTNNNNFYRTYYFYYDDVLDNFNNQI